MNLNKYTIFFLIVFLFSGCSTIQDNLSLKKNSGVDQFLVEKKDPLVLPPDFEELPVPTTLTTQDTEVEKNDENLDIKSLFKEKSKGNLADNSTSKNDLSIKDSIMKKINKNYSPFDNTITTAPIESYFYLGKSYHINGFQDSAIKYLNEFKELATKKHYLKDESKKIIKWCENVKTIANNCLLYTSPSPRDS